MTETAMTPMGVQTAPWIMATTAEASPRLVPRTTVQTVPSPATRPAGPIAMCWDSCIFDLMHISVPLLCRRCEALFRRAA